MAKKYNYFSYCISGNAEKIGCFNVYQSKNGAIYILMGTSFTRLTLKQINELGIEVHSLLDFDYDEFQKAYADYSKPAPGDLDKSKFIKAEPKLINACRSALSYLEILYPDKTYCYPRWLMDQIKEALNEAGVVDVVNPEVSKDELLEKRKFVGQEELDGLLNNSNKKLRCTSCHGVATALEWNNAMHLCGKVDYFDNNEVLDVVDFTCPSCLRNSGKDTGSEEYSIIKETRIVRSYLVEGSDRPKQTLFAVAMQNEAGSEEYMREVHGDDCFSDNIGNALLYENPAQCDKLREREYIVIVAKDEEGWLSVKGKLD